MPRGLICKCCGQSDSVLLVMQVFAPTDVDRSLYIFACSQLACNSRSEGWTVIRNQKRIGDAGVYASSDNKSQASSAIKEKVIVASTPPPKKSMWTFDASAEDDDGVDDLLAMLAVRDESLSAKKKEVSVASPASSSTVALTAKVSVDPGLVLNTSRALPCFAVKEVIEDWDVTIDEDEEEEDMPRSHTDNGHVQRLLDSYLREEEDRDHVTQLQQLGIQRDRGTASKASKGTPNTAAGADDDDDEDEDEGEDEEHDEESKVKYTKSNSKAYKTERYFQRRVSRHPSQVLRYAYGGVPMWISSKIPVIAGKTDGTIAASGTNRRNKRTSAIPIDVPACESCGAPRSFECQLMPAMLATWRCTRLPGMRGNPASSSSSASAASNTAASTTEDDEGAVELDFGVVAVWSCSASCYPSDGIAPQEFLVVQPPLDSL